MARLRRRTVRDHYANVHTRALCSLNRQVAHAIGTATGKNLLPRPTVGSCNICGLIAVDEEITVRLRGEDDLHIRSIGLPGATTLRNIELSVSLLRKAELADLGFRNHRAGVDTLPPVIRVTCIGAEGIGSSRAYYSAFPSWLNRHAADRITLLLPRNSVIRARTPGQPDSQQRGERKGCDEPRCHGFAPTLRRVLPLTILPTLPADGPWVNREKV